MTDSTANFTEIEEEVIYLKAIVEIIDAVINHEVFDLLGEDPNSEVSFKTAIHQRYFNIVLVDFLSKLDSRVVGEDCSYLEAIRLIYENPSFNKNGSIDNLKSAANKFCDWLEQEVEIETWMPSINKNAPLSVKRREFLKICGNISKHNFSRLGSVGKELRDILGRKGITTDIRGAVLTLYDFYEHLSGIINYHGSTIAEFLNNIRWGIHEYLQPELSHSIVYTGGQPLGYRFTYPNGVTDEFAKTCYWDLMNTVHSGDPYVRRFVAPQILKSRY